MENYLETLKQTAESAEVIREKKRIEREEKEAQLDREMIAELTDGLKTKLMQEAEKGNRKFTVLEASMHGSYHKRDAGAFYDYGRCWDVFVLDTSDWGSFYQKRNSEEMIKTAIEKSKGVFKGVYDFCKKEGLNPIVRFFDDGVGQTCGYGIYINW